MEHPSIQQCFLNLSVILKSFWIWCLAVLSSTFQFCFDIQSWFPLSSHHVDQVLNSETLYLFEEVGWFIPSLVIMHKFSLTRLNSSQRCLLSSLLFLTPFYQSFNLTLFWILFQIKVLIQPLQVNASFPCGLFLMCLLCLTRWHFLWQSLNCLITWSLILKLTFPSEL